MISNRRISKGNFIFILCVIIFLTQNILDQYIEIFAYFDELYALIGCVILLVRMLQRGKVLIKKETNKFVLLFCGFVVSGLLGNIIYHYQTSSLVFLDLLTNFKFFGAIITSVVLFRNINIDRLKKHILPVIRIIVTFMFIMLIIDELFHVFPAGDYRYGIASEQLFYVLPTHLAGAGVFIVAILTLFYHRKNNVYIIMSLLIIVSTLRFKAIAAVAAYMIIVWITQIRKKKLKIWQIGMLGLIGIAIAWGQIKFYYIELGGASARSLLTITSLSILKDYFPIGTGFGTFASHAAAVNYSPVYYLYGLNNFYELSPLNSSSFFDDTFWPIILAQTGVIGSICYILLLVHIIKNLCKARNIDKWAYTMVLFIFTYLFISSTSEPAFNNVIAIPLAMLLGYVWTYIDRDKRRNELGL